MNKQTKSLRKRGVSLKFNRGVNLMADAGTPARAQHPEFSYVKRPNSKGRNVDSSFANREKTDNKRKRAYRAPNNPLGREPFAVVNGQY